MRGLFILPAIVLLLATSCASMGAKKHFNAAQRAEERGDLVTAIEEYRAALGAQPNNPSFQSALDRARQAAAEPHVAAARAAEAQQDWAAAAAAWTEALRFLPEDRELTARLELAKLRMSKSDPLEFYAAAQRLSQSLPDDPEARATVERAREDAFGYYARLGDTYFDAGSFASAHAAFESARKVKPDDARWHGLKYRIAHARSLEAQGDERMQAGDLLGAFRAFEESSRLADLPGLAQKLERARRGAGPLIEQLDQARAFERQEKWEDAAELYSLVRDRRDAPGDVAKVAARARQMSAKIRAERAQSFVAQGQKEKAIAALTMALDHTDAAGGVLASLKDSLRAIQGGQVADAWSKLGPATQGAAELPATQAAQDVTLFCAKGELEAAKALAAQDPADAMVRVQRLSPLADRLPGFQRTQSDLAKRAFAALLVRAETEAAEGRANQASSAFVTAIQIAKVPAPIAADMGAGEKALSLADFRAAAEAFDRAIAVDPRSRLAASGKKIARLLRRAELQREAKEAEAADDPLRAAAAYQERLELDPQDTLAKSGLEALAPALAERSLNSADAQLASGHPASAFVYLERALALDPKNVKAKEAVGRLRGSFDLRREPAAWVAPAGRGAGAGNACPGAEVGLRERAILYLTRTRGLGADYLGHEATKEIDAGKQPRPRVELQLKLEECTITDTGGSIEVGLEVRLAGRALFTERVRAAFQPGMLPKDEAQDGIDALKVLDLVSKEAARQVAAALLAHASALKGWRITEAKARLEAGDPEGIAESWAVLTLLGDRLTEVERAMRRDLERQLLVRLR